MFYVHFLLYFWMVHYPLYMHEPMYSSLYVVMHYVHTNVHRKEGNLHHRVGGLENSRNKHIPIDNSLASLLSLSSGEVGWLPLSHASVTCGGAFEWRQ